MDESIAELSALFDIVNSKEGESARPVTLLIGGWAVYTYNAYFGSTDIDIVTTSDRKKHLITGLRHRGFRYHKDTFEDRRLCKLTGAGQIIVDFFNSRTNYMFEGRQETMKFDVLYDGWRKNDIRGIAVPVPSRTALLVTKLKAAWDRSWRIEHSQTADPGHEGNKLVKDYSDIISLIDPDRGGRTLDLQVLGGMLDRYGFLKAVFDRIPGMLPAAQLYGIDQEQMRRTISELVSLL
jgi:hypothetical protein